MYPSKVRLAIWVMFTIVIAVLLLWNPQPPVVEDIPLRVIPERIASAEEYAMNIEDLGKQRLAKRIDVLSKTFAYKGHIVWWHDGRSAGWSYIPAANEDWNIMWQKLARAMNERQAFLMFHPGDESLHKQFSQFPAPYDDLPAGWTIISYPR